ncbi:MAG: molybdopterin-dependent oxidoreductase [Pseudomonadota bacterium]
MGTQAEVKRTICHWCHNRCRVAVTVKNGGLEKIEEDKGHPAADICRRLVRSCAKAGAAREWFHHPDRLNYPRKRMGERGEGKWQTISWDQALDEIASKLKEVKDAYGAEAIANSHGTGRYHSEYTGRFYHLLGSPNHFGQGNICWGPSCVLGAAILGWPHFYSSVSRATKCVMLIGTNPQQAWGPRWQILLGQLKLGAKLIVIDPRLTKTAERADIWLQLRPGTDAALLMGMINIIIEEGLHDKEFVDKWCYGFSELAERARQFPVDEVARITQVSTEVIRDAARLYATTKPATIFASMGIEHQSKVIENIHARLILPAITGNYDNHGGEMLRGMNPHIIGPAEIELPDKLTPEQKKKQIGADRFKLMTFPGYELIKKYAKTPLATTQLGAVSQAPLSYRAMLTGKPYPVRALITNASNPMVTASNTKLVYKALRSLDLYVVMDYWMTPSAAVADYVLPAASWLERPCIENAQDTVPTSEVGEQALPNMVEGNYDRRPDYDLWRGLGMRLGQEEYWPWENLEQALNYRLAPLGYTIKEAIDKVNGRIEGPAKEERKYERIGFGTPTGKLELYSTILEKLGYDPLPNYEEPHQSPFRTPELAKEYPFILITGGRHLPFFHSEHRQVEAIRKEHPYPLTQIHPKTASELGIGDGDWVWIETGTGRVRQKCQLFTGIAEGVIHSEHGWWFPELPGEEPWLHGVWESNINVALDDDPETCNRMSGGWPLRASLCKVYKAVMY